MKLNSERFRVIPVVSNGKDGFPHITLLSVGEICLINSSRLNFCVHNMSATAQNLMEHPFATFSFIEEGKHLVLKFRSILLQRRLVDDLDLIFFEGVLVREKVDQVGYAMIDIATEFRLTNNVFVFRRWRKQWTILEKTKLVIS